jgi:hypothetical protein
MSLIDDKEFISIQKATSYRWYPLALLYLWLRELSFDNEVLMDEPSNAISGRCRNIQSMQDERRNQCQATYATRT